MLPLVEENMQRFERSTQAPAEPTAQRGRPAQDLVDDGKSVGIGLERELEVVDLARGHPVDIDDLAVQQVDARPQRTANFAHDPPAFVMIINGNVATDAT